MNNHWRRSALDSAGALQSVGGEFRGILTLFYTINFRGLCKSGGARAPAAPPSSAPMQMIQIQNGSPDNSFFLLSDPTYNFQQEEQMNERQQMLKL